MPKHTQKRITPAELAMLHRNADAVTLARIEQARATLMLRTKYALTRTQGIDPETGAIIDVPSPQKRP